MPSRPACVTRVLLALALLVVLAPAASALPAFARRYRVSCQQCHHPMPRLTAFGEMFASHGFRMVAAEPPADTIDTGDDLLALPRELPLAVRVDGFARVSFDRHRGALDLEAPFVMKLLSSAPLSTHLSYYFYFLMSEHGEIAGVEDAFLYWDDLAGRPVDLTFGQFQVSDPVFKRELRLPFEDYVVYGTTVGDQHADLTYDRGVTLSAELAGATATLELLNGNGIGAADGRGRFDDDALKNVFVHLSRPLSPALRLGALAYHGRQALADAPAGTPQSRVWMAGGDATVGFDALELDGQYVHREDEHPTFSAGEPRSVVDGGFVQALWLPQDQRWYALAIWNRVTGSRAILDFGLGAPPRARVHESAALGGGYLVRRNLRVSGELGWDLEQEQGRATLGMSLAY